MLCKHQNNQFIVYFTVISAVRNIALSPFFILMAGLLALIFIYLLGFMVEWLLMRFDLYRENLYAKIPLVTTTWDEYDPDRHYVSTEEDTESTAADMISDELQAHLGGAGPLSPRTRKKRKYMASSLASPGTNFSPIQRSRGHNEDEIELSVISPREAQFVPLDDAEQVNEGATRKNKRTNGNNLKTPIRGRSQRGFRTGNGDQKAVLSPDKSFGARTLAQLMFKQRLSRSYVGSVDLDEEDQATSGHEQRGGLSDLNASGCKQQ